MSDLLDDSKYGKHADYILENYTDENSKFLPSIWVSQTRKLHIIDGNVLRESENRFFGGNGACP
jgi:hypothetical protein